MLLDKKGCAINFKEDEKYYLEVIANEADVAAAKRAKILLSIKNGKSINETSVISNASVPTVVAVKKQWVESILTGREKADFVCFGLSRVGSRSKGKRVKEKVDIVLQYNNLLNQGMSRHARSQAIVEMAEKEGLKLSIRTVTRFLKEFAEVK
ncbi:hypothetical protein NIES2101_37015 [Calothrix sp. HK-06]|nr:hypothetical protein NIES2101_37015 [Calothrix sp. HK-06]